MLCENERLPQHVLAVPISVRPELVTVSKRSMFGCFPGFLFAGGYHTHVLRAKHTTRTHPDSRGEFLHVLVRVLKVLGIESNPDVRGLPGDLT
jgi:hypothetical protein